MDTIYKTFKAECKAVDDNEGTLDMFIPISTSSVDRDGEVVDPQAFKKTIPKFMKHPVLVASHDYRDLTNLIGEWKKLKVEEDGILGKPKYYINAGNGQADWAYYLASKGVAAFSIGFIPIKWEDGNNEKLPKRTFLEIELLEISQVIIPSNREAIQSVRSKSIDPIVKELCDEAEKLAPIDTEIEPVEKPYPNEHACRLQSPDKFSEFRRGIRTHEDKKYSVIFGKPKEGEGWEEQAYRYDKDTWQASEARSHCKSHDGSFEAAKPEKISQEEIIDEIDYLMALIDKEGIGDKVKKSLQDLTKRTSGSDIPVAIVSSNDETDKKSETLNYSDIKESIKRILEVKNVN